jgi:mRNA interferase RelE/StbE
VKESLYKLRIADSVAGLIRGMHPLLRKKVKASLKTILLDPHSGKVLKDELSGLLSFRVSNFRIIYKISGKEIQIVATGPRKTIYEETFRIIKRENKAQK